MEIRKATPADAAAISRVHVNAWQATYAGLVPQEFLDGLSAEQREPMWKKTLNEIEAGERTNIIFVALDNAKQIVGFVDGGKTRSNQDEFDCELFAIYIEEHAQRKGVGMALTSALCEAFLERGFKKMRVWVLDGNDSKQFYERIGGQELSERKLITIGGRECMCVGYGYTLNLMPMPRHDCL